MEKFYLLIVSVVLILVNVGTNELQWMIKSTIILFFTISFLNLNLTGQSKINGQWGLQDHRNLIFTFEDSSKLLIEGENSQNGSLFPQEFEINIENSLIIQKSW